MAGAASFPFEVLVDLPATLCIGLPDLVEIRWRGGGE